MSSFKIFSSVFTLKHRYEASLAQLNSAEGSIDGMKQLLDEKRPLLVARGEDTAAFKTKFDAQAKLVSEVSSVSAIFI